MSVGLDDLGENGEVLQKRIYFQVDVGRLKNTTVTELQSLQIKNKADLASAKLAKTRVLDTANLIEFSLASRGTSLFGEAQLLKYNSSSAYLAPDMSNNDNTTGLLRSDDHIAGGWSGYSNGDCFRTSSISYYADNGIHAIPLGGFYVYVFWSIW